MQKMAELERRNAEQAGRPLQQASIVSEIVCKALQLEVMQ